MSKSVYDLTRDQLDELKAAYFWDDDAQDAIPEDCTSPDEIPDEIILDHYNGIDFVDDDFFCTAGC